MNINPNYEKQDQPSAVDITTMAMDAVFSIAIKPMEKDLTIEQVNLLAEVGIALKIIAKQADAYTKLRSHGNEYYKN